MRLPTQTDGEAGGVCPACFYLLRHLARHGGRWAACYDDYLAPPPGTTREAVFAAVWAAADPAWLRAQRDQVQRLLRARSGEAI